MSRQGVLAEGSSLAPNTLFSTPTKPGQRLTWRKMMWIAERCLPSPNLRHPNPDWRFEVMTRGGSRSR
jgi:hypothetical protein